MQVFQHYFKIKFDALLVLNQNAKCNLPFKLFMLTPRYVIKTHDACLEGCCSILEYNVKSIIKMWNYLI
jgi:hypothetical protein